MVFLFENLLLKVLRVLIGGMRMDIFFGVKCWVGDSW